MIKYAIIIYQICHTFFTESFDLNIERLCSLYGEVMDFEKHFDNLLSTNKPKSGELDKYFMFKFNINQLIILINFITFRGLQEIKDKLPSSDILSKTEFFQLVTKLSMAKFQKQEGKKCLNFKYIEILV